LNHLKELVDLKPKKILIDLHPEYFSSQEGQKLSEIEDIPLVQIQHHEAHFAAVLLENDLVDSDQKVLGVIWDGLGFGSDGNYWGSEFFTYSDNSITRIDHLPYAPLIAGDKMAKEPRIALFAFASDELDGSIQSKFSKVEWEIYSREKQKPKNLTSSMGRLFDAVASLIGLIDASTFEGQAAMYLEKLGFGNTVNSTSGYCTSFESFDVSRLLLKIENDLTQGIDLEEISFKFHLTLVEWIEHVALREEISNITFSGGVFQNALLIKLIRQNLGNNFNLYFHKHLSPNDENISFGQICHYHISARSKNQSFEIASNEISV
jgi:hydrogenase maturation protein HypF